MAKKKKKLKAQEDELLNIDATAVEEKLSQAEHFIANNRRLLSGVSLGVVLIIVGLTFYNNWLEEQNITAQEELAPAIFFFEKGQVDAALTGDGNTTGGFLSIIDDYGNTKAANLAHFYAGIIYLTTSSDTTGNNLVDAIEHLKAFDSDDLFLQARAYALLGDAYSAQNDYQSAIDYYQQAIDYKPNRMFTPIYLLKLALAQEQNQELEKAKKTYLTIIDNYPNLPQTLKAKKYLALIP